MAVITPTQTQTGFRNQVLYTWTNMDANIPDTPVAVEVRGVKTMQVSVAILAAISIGTITIQGCWTDSAVATDWFTLQNPIGSTTIGTFTGSAIGVSTLTMIGSRPYWIRPFFTAAGALNGRATVRLLAEW